MRYFQTGNSLIITGVYDEPECRNGRFDLDHAVLVVGYGTDEDSGEDYWLVKNRYADCYN